MNAYWITNGILNKTRKFCHYTSKIVELRRLILANRKLRKKIVEAAFGVKKLDLLANIN